MKYRIILLLFTLLSLSKSKRRFFTNNTDPLPTEDNQCPVELIPINQSDIYHQCRFVWNLEECENEFFWFYYCLLVPGIHPYSWLYITIFTLIGIYIVLLMFYIIADTTDAFLIPSIIKICDFFKIPNTIAGVTLLAFGNGSADVFSIVAGIVTGNTDLALSAPIGAGVFVSGVCLALVILFARPMKTRKTLEEIEKEKKEMEERKMKKKNIFTMFWDYMLKVSFKAPVSAFVRDISFYITAVTVMLTFYLLGFVPIFIGLFLIGLYITYVFTVIIGRYCYQKCILPKIILRDKVKKQKLKYGTTATQIEQLLDDNSLVNDEEIFDENLEKQVEDYLKKDEMWTGGWNIHALNPSKSTKEKQKKQLEDIGFKFIDDEKEEKTSFFGSINLRDSSIVESRKGGITSLIIPSHFSEKEKDTLKVSTEKKKLVESVQEKEIMGEIYPLEEKEKTSDETLPEKSEKPKEIDKIDEEKELILTEETVPVMEEASFIENGDLVFSDVKEDDLEVVDHKKKSFIRGVFDEIVEQIAWSEKSFISKVIYITFGYSRLFRNFFIPRAEKEEWMKFFACFSPGCGLIFCFFIFFKLIGYFKLEYYIFLLCFFGSLSLIGIVLGLIVYFTTERHRPPIYNILFVVLAFFSGMCFVYISAEILVKILTLFGKIVGIPPSFLGLTILAWGNTLPDSVSNIIVSRKGFSAMAMGACVGEPLLNSLVGIGFLFTFQSFTNGIKYGWWCYPVDVDPALAVSFIALLFQSIMSLSMVFIMRYKMRTFYGWVLILFYAFQLILALITVIPDGWVGGKNWIGWFFGILRIKLDLTHVCPVD